MDTTVADFSAGTPAAGAAVSQIADGEVILAPAVNEEFGGTTLPATWFVTPSDTGGTATISGGTLSLDGARAGTNATYGAGRSLEFVGTFAVGPNQHAGFGVNFSSPPWAMFSVRSDGTFNARTHNGTSSTDTLLSASLLGSPHRYRIEWNASTVVFSVDGTPVATQFRTFGTAMRPLANDLTTGGGSVSIDWMRMSPFAASGSFDSRIFDAGQSTTWGTLSWTNALPTGTAVTLSIRTGDVPTPDASWTAFQPIDNGSTIGPSSRYLQYRAALSTTNSLSTPELQDVTIGGAPAAAPTITGFNPTSGAVGASVVITGTSFTGTTAVRFNGTAASFTVNSATQITATVPAGATTGPISVATPGGTATSASNFTVVPAPTITGFSPTSGAVGASVVITGTSFSVATAVRFNGTAASFTVNSATQITATVPTGATTGPIAVTTPGGTATTASSFTVIPAPTISSFSPTSGPVGASVVITGTNFSGATAVRFNGVSGSFTVNSATQITATVPAGAPTGPIAVTTPGGTATSANSFTVIGPPTISSFNPTSGSVGRSVKINGTNFTGATTVRFNGVSASFTVKSSTVINAIVPAGATTGQISVVTPSGTATSASNFTVR